jgi:RNA polymerase sigma factor (sigma-70 family)
MATGHLTSAVRHLRRAAILPDGAGLTDGQLLDAFLRRCDEAAFEVLVRRHGPMVLGVCRRVLGNDADAEDAFQATFLVLVKKAGSIVPRGRVGNWLYGVAHNTALKAKAMRSRRRLKEREAGSRPRPETSATEWQHLHAALDDELGRLPEKYRAAIVLCDLEGRPIKKAARQLGWPQGTLASRLSRGRVLLARRLARHGAAVSGGVLAAVLSREAAAAVPAPLLSTTVKAAAHVAAGGAAAAAVSVTAAALTEGMVRSMLLKKLRLTACVFLALLGLGGALLPGRGPTAQAQTKGQPAAKAPGKPAPAKAGRLYYQLDFDFATVQPDGKKSENLSRVAAEDIYGYQTHSARLSPDGKQLAFGKAVVKQVAGGLGFHPPDKIYLRDVTKKADAVLLVERPGESLGDWVWSPDGSRLAFSTADGKGSLRNWIVDVKTKKVTAVKLPRFKADGKEYTMAIEAWSPDGQWFLAQGDGLHLVKTDGTGAKRLTKAGLDVLSGTCSFSPDGRKVLFTVINPGRKSMSLYVADVPGGKERALVEASNFNDVHACWSPDSRRVAYCARLLDEAGDDVGETSLFVTDAAGRETTTVRTEQHKPQQIRLRLLGWR